MNTIDLNNAEKLILYVLEECQSRRNTAEIIHLLRDLEPGKLEELQVKLKLVPTERVSLEFYLISACLHRLHRLDLLRLDKEDGSMRRVIRSWACTSEGRSVIRGLYLSG